ncbi:glycoside hydrolase family 3 N-terminal domain-containing protein [Microbacterium thalassium]|uniref:Beta-glucosidase n=1 Tax=Microbacterium thalassium TaxID=362649 RepID=A0A7X0FNF0_9MICO|nr:glycoside hydrolase family 3 N-terminal domain-containing protein [Microbacterium thalassium]MBB6390725.1 beta-glucosidase [Microbacterium thalassium]GLK25834.1 glycosyl hydrolase [Microbacterium thalassium]
MKPTTKPWHDTIAAPETRAAALLSEMTLSEKLAQLGSYWPRPEEPEAAGDVAPMESAFDFARRPFADAVTEGLGQLTRVFGTVPLEPAEGMAVLRRMQSEIVAASRFGIPAIAHEECLTGFTAYRASVFPAAIAWGATFDPDAIGRMAAAIGRDMRVVGVHQGLSPLMDVVRDYRWGRVEETIGEDPYLVGTLGAAYVRGLQSSGIIATLKHFAGYPASKAGRNHAPVGIGPREFADVILTPFEIAVREGGAGSVMNSYSDIDGLPAAASPQLLTRVLRDTWGFAGTVVSDYGAVAFLDMMHRVTADRAASGAVALTAGIDVELPETDAYGRLVPMVESGALDEAYVDRAALRVLTQKAALGLLDPGWSPVPAETGDGMGIDLDRPENREIAREIAEKSITVLSNGGILPLGREPRRIAVVGPSAGEPRTFLGCYSFPIHVLARYTADGTGVPVRSLAAALQETFDTSTIIHRPGVPILESDRSGIGAAVAAATEADVAIVTVGDLASLFGRGTSGEGCDAEDLTLPGVQGELVEAILATDTPVVLVVVSGRPYALGAYVDRCAAIVQAFMPGEEGGGAIARVLAGDVNPSGRLPVGIPRTPGGQPGTYLTPPLGRFSDGISNLDPSPLFPFGHGLSYSSFRYAEPRASATRVPTDGAFEVGVTVTNIGDRPGDEVVQLYLTDEVAQVTRPVRALIGYRRVSLEPGESARVTFLVDAERTVFTGVDLQRIVEPGWIVLTLGRSSEDTAHQVRIELTGAVRAVPAPVLVTPARVEYASSPDR